MLRRVSSLLVSLLTVGGVGAANAAILPTPATLDVAIGSLPSIQFSGAASASSAGNGGAATLPAGALSGIFSATLSPPLLTLLDGIGVAAPGACCTFPAAASPASNGPLSFDGTTGTMALNASAYLLMSGNISLEIPLGVVGVGGTQMFHALTLVGGTIFANPYQLGMLTLMGALNTAPHTLTSTGFDARSAGGAGQLVLVSPTTVNLGPLGTLAAISTLTLGVPEPGTLALVLLGVAGLAARGWRQGRGSADPHEAASRDR
jgi:hypothetical protein